MSGFDESMKRALLPPMTLRDYFAAAAMSFIQARDNSKPVEAELVAIGCYTIADAMLAERAK